jgi:hypothetical protein
MSEPAKTAGVSCAAVAGGVALLAGATLLLHLLPETSAGIAAAKLVCGSLTIAFGPGLLITLAARPMRGSSFFEVVGLAIALSFALVQLLVMISLALHVPTAWIATGLTLATAGSGALVARMRRAGGERFPVTRDEVALGLVLAWLVVPLYLKGSPFLSYEDHVHAGMVRRLAFVSRPALDDFYVVPNVVYTYPFPGTHFFMALVSRASGLDPLFVYHKLRAFWGPTALLFLYLVAGRLFRSRRIAFLTALTAVILVVAGTFADVPGMYWGQLVPYSHPSDVAMNVLLPGLLFVALCFLEAREAGGSRFLFWTTIALTATVAMVHIREIVQFAMYLASFGLALLLIRREPAYLARAGGLLLATVAVTGLYVLFHKLVVGHVAIQEAAARHALAEEVGRLSLAKWFSRPLPAVSEFGSVFYGWNPLVIVASPVICLAFRRRVQMLLVLMSMLVYLLLIRVPVFTFPYVYLTYWEILVTPVRNVALFIYLLTGAGLYLVAINLARIRTRMAALAAGAACGLGLALVLSLAAGVLERHRDLLFLPALLLSATALFLMRGARGDRWAAALRPASPRPIWKGIFLLLLLFTAVASGEPHRSPLALHAVTTAISPFPMTMPVFLTPRTMMDDLPCIRSEAGSLPVRHLDLTASLLQEPVVSCPPSYRLVRWAKGSLPPDAVLVANAWNVYAPSPYFPQHVFSGLPARSGVDPKLIYPDYYQRFERAWRSRGVQPLFNDVESLEDRLAFLGPLGITHLVVDPMYYEQMRTTLGRWPETFRPIYDDGRWAVFAVVKQKP